jgi:hypothetical protein
VLTAWLEAGLLEVGLVAALFISVCGLLVAVVAIVSLRRQARFAAVQILRLEQELALLNSGAVGLGKRLLALEQNVRQTQRQPTQSQPEYQPQPQPSQSQPQFQLQPEFQHQPQTPPQPRFQPEPAPPAAPIPAAMPVYAEGSSYSDATRLLSMGLEVDEVARRCGLSRSEVALMQLMAAQGKQGSTL